MPVNELLQDNPDWSVSLRADTPRSVIQAVDVRTYAYATLLVTPLKIDTSSFTDAQLLDAARFTGRYLAMSDGQLNLEGDGLIGWLGDENDGGQLYVGVDTTAGPFNLADQLDARIFTGASNGLTRGTTDALATTRTIKLEAGTTPRQNLDTICALYDSTPLEWRCNTDGRVDVDHQADLYPTTTTPTAILTKEGGRDTNLNGVYANLQVSGIDFSDYRTGIYVDWDDAANTGLATNTPTSTWVDFAGATPVIRSLIDWRPRRDFQDRTDRWSARVGGSKYAAWALNALVQANNVATRAANRVNSYAVEVKADIDEYDPWRFFQVGDSVWVYDQELGLTDSANEVYYRGVAIRPQKLRVQAMTSPIRQGYGVYLRYWTGAAFAYYDLSPYVEYEEGPVTLELGTRDRFHRKNARPQRINRRSYRQQFRDHYRLARYLNTSP